MMSVLHFFHSVVVGPLAYLILFVFFFKQKTAYEMRISDWSSDVCSSDLRGRARPDHDDLLAPVVEVLRPELRVDDLPLEILAPRESGVEGLVIVIIAQIGRASCRERVCQYV